MPKPPTTATLTWREALVFDAVSAGASLTVDSDGREGPSPVQTLVISLAGCMSIDVAHILKKGRHRFASIRTDIVAERAPADPHRVVRVTLRIAVGGGAARDAVERAVALSREKYCSVWHSMRDDIELATICDVD